MRTSIVLFAAVFACSDGTDTGDTDVGTDSDTGTDTDTDTEGVADVVISALLADNEAADVDEAGQNEDWLELTNQGTVSVDLAGWGLSDDYPLEVPWRFPADTVLQPDATLRVWCDKDAEDGPLHADFKLSKDGETVTLLDTADVIVDEVTFPALGVDEVYTP